MPPVQSTIHSRARGVESIPYPPSWSCQ